MSSWTGKKPIGSAIKYKHPEWVCIECSKINEKDVKVCIRCGVKKINP